MEKIKNNIQENIWEGKKKLKMRKNEKKSPRKKFRIGEENLKVAHEEMIWN